MEYYHINVFYSEKDSCYVADIPDLRFCTAFGENPEEALRQVQKAKKAWLTSAKKNGKPIPKPKYKPAMYKLLS